MRRHCMYNQKASPQDINLPSSALDSSITMIKPNHTLHKSLVYMNSYENLHISATLHPILHSSYHDTAHLAQNTLLSPLTCITKLDYPIPSPTASSQAYPSQYPKPDLIPLLIRKTLPQPQLHKQRVQLQTHDANTTSQDRKIRES
jgi:hypothetical protein